MKYTAQKSSSGLSYTEFARQKYTELKASHPFKSDQEIYSMANKQWESTKRKTKSQVQNSSSQVKNENQEEIMSDESFQVKEQTDPVRKKLAYPQIKGIKKNIQEDNENVSITSTPKKEMKTKKRIFKLPKEQKENEYLEFFRFYYKKLHREHPRWGRDQINTIIKLLWKKKKVISLKQSKIPSRAPQIKTGRKTFKNAVEPIEKKTAQELWKALPRESKRYWKNIGAFKQGISSPIEIAPREIYLTLDNKTPFEQNNSPILSNSLSFMNNLN